MGELQHTCKDAEKILGLLARRLNLYWFGPPIGADIKSMLSY